MLVSLVFWALKLGLIIALAYSLNLPPNWFTFHKLAVLLSANIVLCFTYICFAIMVVAVALSTSAVHHKRLIRPAGFMLCVACSLSFVNASMFLAMYLTRWHASVDDKWVDMLPERTRVQTVLLNIGPILLLFLENCAIFFNHAREYAKFLFGFYAIYYASVQYMKPDASDHIIYCVEKMDSFTSALFFLALWFASSSFCNLFHSSNKIIHS